MNRFRLLLFVIFSVFLILPASAQDSYAFPDGPVLNVPIGWEILGESDQFGNLSLTRPDGDTVNTSMPPPEDLEPVLAEQGIDLEDGLESLLEAVLESEGVALTDGTLETANYGDAEILIFVNTRENGEVRYNYLGKYPNRQIFFVQIHFDSGEIDQAMLDDVVYMFENVEFSEDVSMTSADTEQIEPPKNLGLFTMRDNTMFAVPVNWDMVEFTEEYGSYRFEVNNADIRFELPSIDVVEPALADLGLAEDEIIPGLVELNITGEHFDTPFDPENIEYTDINGGQLGSYVSVQDGETLAVFIARYDNARLVALRVETMGEYSDDFDAIIRSAINTVTFDGTPADFTTLSELVGDVELSAPSEDVEAPAPTQVLESPSEAELYLETATYTFEEVNISFEYPTAWLVNQASNGLDVRFDDVFSGAEIAVMLPVEEEIVPQLEAMGIDPESETLAVDLMQMLLARQDADGNLEMPPAEDINTFTTNNATVANAIQVDGGYTDHFYLLTFDNGGLALMNIAGDDLPDALFDALIPLIESFDFGE